MLNKIIGFSIRNKLFVGLMVLGLVVFGIYQVTQLPIDAVPDITNNQVQIITVAPSFGATDIERLVTFPVEQAVSNIPDLKEMRSFSRFGLSLVTVVFDDDVDIYLARQQVSEKLLKVKDMIPAGVGSPELGPVTTGLGEIYQYTIKATKGYELKYNETELRTLQDWVVRRQLLGVSGVAEVSSFGGKLKQYSIEVEPNKLQSYNLTITDVMQALANNNQNTGGAYIEKGPTVLYIRSEGLLADIEQINNISIKMLADGTPLFIRDVAQVVIGHATRYGALTYNDEGEVAGGVVMMLKGANSSKVIKSVKERVAQIQATLPKGVIIEPFLDRTKMVNNAISTVEKNLVEGALIVVFVLVLFLGNFRAGLLVASVIPLAMLFAVIMMNLFGVGGNLMSLGALDFGLIVDGAVIIVEAVLHQMVHSHRLRHVAHLQQSEMDETVKNSAGKMMSSAVFGQIIILVVYLPIFSLQGIEGKMFRPMAQTVAFALLGAFLLSLTYIPMMSALVLSRKISHTPNISDKLMLWVETGYQRMLSRVIRFPKTVLTIAIGLFVVAVVIMGTLGGEFIPTLEEGDFAVETRVLTGSSLSTTIAATQKAAHILKTRFPEVEKVVTKIGSGEVPTDPMPMEACDMIIVLKDKSKWTSATTYSELSDKMGKALAEVPGITTGFQFPVQMRFNELMTGAKQDVVCKIFGEDLDSLSAFANTLGKIIGTVDGAKELYVETVSGIPQIVITYNRSAIAQYNLHIAEVNNTVNAALAGQQCGTVYEGEKRFDMVVRLSNNSKKDLSDIEHLLISAPNGIQIPLNQLANLSIQEGPYQIQREDTRRRIVVGFNVRGRDVQTIVNELKLKVNQQMPLQAGYSVTYGGVFENLIAAKQRLLIAVPISLALIFLLLFFAFNSVRHALLIYSAIPLSAIGGIFFLAIRGMPFSISAGVGFIALFGVAVLNGIVLIAEFNRLKNEGTLTSLTDIILKGTQTRLRPVLMTAFVASLGFLPMALSNGAGAEVQRPLATVVIGGLLIATFLTLFVLPVLYLLFERVKKPKKGSVPLAVLLIAGILAIGKTTQAQSPIALSAAIDTAIGNNLLLKTAQLKAQYQQLLIKTGSAIPLTLLAAETGRFNSAYTDTRFSLSQSVSFPTVYKRQQQLLTEEWKNTTATTLLKATELKKQVAHTYYDYLILNEKKKLLAQADSLYTMVYTRAKLRLEKGETNLLEKANAATHLGQIHTQLEAVIQDMEVITLQFNVLLNSTQNWIPAYLDVKMDEPNVDNRPSNDQHPYLQLLQHDAQISIAALKLARAKMLPDLTITYNNTSIKGIGADERYYNTSQRFQSVQVGIGIPLFPSLERAKIGAAAFYGKIATNNINTGKQQFQNEYTVAKTRYLQYKKAVTYYETEALKNAVLISDAASSQLYNGSINFLEWTQLINQSLSIRNEYIDAVKQLNESIIQLQYFNQ